MIISVFHQIELANSSCCLCAKTITFSTSLYLNFHTGDICVIVMGHLSLVHTSDIGIRTRSIRKQSIVCPQGLAKIKQQELFFILFFVQLFADTWTMTLSLRLRRSFCRRLDFIPLFCLLFCLHAYAYAHV